MRNPAPPILAAAILLAMAPGPGTTPAWAAPQAAASAKPASGISASTLSMDCRMKQTNGGNATCNKPSALMWSISPLII